jgi:protein TonB
MGAALSVHILKSSGYFRLDQAARRAVEHWRFHPGMTAGISVSSEADVPIRFTLQQ